MGVLELWFWWSEERMSARALDRAGAGVGWLGGHRAQETGVPARVLGFLLSVVRSPAGSGAAASFSRLGCCWEEALGRGLGGRGLGTCARCSRT